MLGRRRGILCLGSGCQAQRSQDGESPRIHGEKPRLNPGLPQSACLNPSGCRRPGG